MLRAPPLRRVPAWTIATWWWNRIRHHKADQRGDYDDAYLDWLFWWYLATVDLTNRLIAREGGRGD